MKFELPIISLATFWLVAPASTASVFAGFAMANNKSNGFGNKKKQNSRGEKNQEANLETIQLGPHKSVHIWIPPNELEGSRDETSKFMKNKANLLEAYADFRGTGDVIWPSALHLARLVANCPSFVSGKRVLDLGCGLGLVSLAAILGGPSELTLCDVDKSVLEMAWKSCASAADQITGEENTNNPCSLFKLELDWRNPATWPEKGSVDVVLASDILYDEDATLHVNRLITHLLGDDYLLATSTNGPTGRALIVDPISRSNRDAFAGQALQAGLTAGMAPFPGQENEFVLINVTPRTAF